MEQVEYVASIKRKGRFKKGEKKVVSGRKDMTATEALKSIEGLIHKLSLKYKSACIGSITFDDLVSAAYEGALHAYQDWDASQAKFITHAYQRIERSIDLFLIEMNPKYKNSVDAKLWLRTKNGESFDDLKKKKLTKDVEFNKLYELDGVKPFSKDMYNAYAEIVANKLFNNGHNFVVTSVGAMKTSEGVEYDFFDMISYAENEDTTELEQYIDNMKEDGTDRKTIAKMLFDGHSIPEIAKSLGMKKADIYKACGIKKDSSHDEF